MCVKKSRPRVDVLGNGEGLSLMITLQNARWCTHRLAHTHRLHCPSPTLSPNLLNTYQWGLALCVWVIIITSDFSQRLQNNRGGGLMWEEDPWDSADVLSWKMNVVIDKLTICTHTQTRREHRTAVFEATDNCSFSSLLYLPFSFPLSLMLAQTNQCTCVLTPKSQSLTRPRVFTSILEGLTSVETNCFIELQHQHTVACLYQPCSFLITRRPCTTLLTSVKYLQAPQIRQAFDYLETQAAENNYQFWQHEACNQHTPVNNNYFTLTRFIATSALKEFSYKVQNLAGGEQAPGSQYAAWWKDSLRVTVTV